MDNTSRSRPSALPDTALEDYLKTIYQHTEWQNEPITPSVLAAKLGIAPPSVTEMVKKLVIAGLVNHVPYGPLTLTRTGAARATGVIRRHRLIETWLVREMGYHWDEVHDEAEILEHSISDKLLDAIDKRLGCPEQDPHGDPIPAADGTVKEYQARLLMTALPGDCGTIIRINDRNPDLLRHLAEISIGPGTPLCVKSTDKTSISVVAARSGAIQVIPASAGDAIWITA